jgi:hypothetical protein
VGAFGGNAPICETPSQPLRAGGSCSVRTAAAFAYIADSALTEHRPSREARGGGFLRQCADLRNALATASRWRVLLCQDRGGFRRHRRFGALATALRWRVLLRQDRSGFRIQHRFGADGASPSTRGAGWGLFVNNTPLWKVRSRHRGDACAAWSFTARGVRLSRRGVGPFSFCAKRTGGPLVPNCAGASGCGRVGARCYRSGLSRIFD